MDGFNEAAAFQLRNPYRSSRHHCALPCFNEAAAFQLRNPTARFTYPTGSLRFNEAAAFQLRNLRDAIALWAGWQASMRPQRFSCGISLLSCILIG